MRTEKERRAALMTAFPHIWPDAHDGLINLADEATREPAWRVMRAAIAHAKKPGEHMTAVQFAFWLEVNKLVSRRMGLELPHRALNLSKEEPKAYASGRRPVALTLALACAHLHFGLKLPCELTTNDFAAWFTPRFGNAGRISEWLEIKGDRLNDALRGYDLRAEGRAPRLPEPVMVRALDWVARHGPTNPWNRAEVACFPDEWKIR